MEEAVAFVCAMPMELAALRRRLSLVKVGPRSAELYRGSIGGKAAVAVVTGMGTELASKGTERLLEETEIERVVVVGITGALDDHIAIGTVVDPVVVVNADTGSEFRPEHIGAGSPSGKMRTSNTFSTAPEVLADLRTKGFVAVDMETAAVAQVCERRGIPWSVFRAVSDRATDESVDEEVFRLSKQDGRPDARAVLSYFVKHPSRVPAMVRLARDAKLATTRAAEAAVGAVKELYG